MPSKKTPSADPITPEEAKNSRPSDLYQEAADNLAEEAQHFLDGAEITSDAEATGVERLLDLANTLIKEADEARAVEKKPFDDAGKEVQARYKPILDRAERIKAVCKKALTPWRQKIADQKRKEAEEARLAAEELRRKAEEAKRAAGTHLGANEIADNVAEDAERIEKHAQRMARDADKGLRLRKSYDVSISDRRSALTHYNSVNPRAFEELVLQLAREDVHRGAREIPGFSIIENKGAF